MTKRQFGLFLLGLTVALVIFGGNLGRRHLYESEEARFALLAQDIVARGDWLLPRLRGEPYMNKPPLFIWLIALLSLPGRHVTDFTAQVPAAVGAAGTVIGTALIGTRLGGLPVGLLAALILGTSLGFVHHAGLVLTETVLVCFMVFALHALYIGILQQSRRALAIGYGLVGLAVLSKGPVGFLALGPAAAAAFDRYGWRGWKALSPLIGVGVLVAVLAPSVLTYLTRGADQYLDAVWRGDYLAWVWVTHSTQRPPPPLFPLASLGMGTLPWSLLLPLFLEGRRSRWWAHEGSRWVVYWLGLMLVVFLLIAAKRTRYLLPLYPAVSLLLAQQIDSLRSASFHRFRLTAALWIAGSGIALGLLLGAGHSGLRWDALVFFPASRLEVAAAVLAVVTGAVLGGLRLWQGRMLSAALTVALSTATLLIIVGVGYPARYNAAYDIRGLAARAEGFLGPDDALVTYRYAKLSLDFYLGRPVPEVLHPSDLRSLLAGPGRVLCVMEERQPFPDDADSWVVLDRMIIGGRAVLLVANRST